MVAATTSTQIQPLLEARSLYKRFRVSGGFFSADSRKIDAVSDVSLQLHRGDRVGLLGESGCGKSTLGRLLLGLLPPTSGDVVFRGERLADLSNAQLRQRRRHMQLVFQDPMGSLNPRMRVGKAAVEPLQVHGMMNPGESWKETAGRLFTRVGLAPELATRFPHQLSGGQRQRACIARAIATEPEILVADEPVASLDISVQTQILELLATLFAGNDGALLMVSHDVRVIKALCKDVVVMYLGWVVERGPAHLVLNQPAHPYTQALLAAVPALHPDHRHDLRVAEDAVDRTAQGCPYLPRCDRKTEACGRGIPDEMPLPDGRTVRCITAVNHSDD